MNDCAANTNQTNRLRRMAKSVLIGALATFCLLLPWGLFGAWFWNSWNGGDGTLPRPDGLHFWTQVIRDALGISFYHFVHWCFITFPVALFIAYRVYRRKPASALNQDTNQRRS